LAISARRIDTVQKSIETSAKTDALLGYTFTLATETIRNKEFRTNLLRMILLIYQRKQASSSDTFDYYKIAKCQFHLNLPEGTSQLLEKLILTQDSDDFLIAY
jgi:26S proteasome regulatory subunit N2